MVVCEGVARESRATVGWHHIQEVGCEERGDESAHDLEVVGERTYWMFSVHVLQLAWRLARSSLRRALDVGPRGEARSGAPGEGAGAGAWRGGGPGRRGADRYVSVLSRIGIALVSNENRTIRSNDESNRAAFLFFRTQPKSYTIPHVEVYVELETHTSAARFTHNLAVCNALVQCSLASRSFNKHIRYLLSALTPRARRESSIFE